MSQTPPGSLPPSHPTPYRHLGVGNADRSVRVQMIIALVAGLVMVAVPLYLWRLPRADAADREARKADPAASGGLSPLAPPTSPAGASPTGGSPVGAASPSSNAGAGSRDAPPSRGVTLGEPRLVKCSKGSAKTPVEQCDRQPYFEEALVKAIQDNASCAPAGAQGGTINFVLDVDHKAKKLKVWAGKSGSIKKKGRKEVIACVNRSLPTPDWSQIPHQHTKYQIAVMGTYPGGGAAP